MTDWLPDLAASGGSKFRAIAAAVESAIGSGALRPGDRLPPQRELASRLAVDLTTVTRAYDLARQRGLIEPRGRSGSFVRERDAGAPVELPVVDTGMNMPPLIDDVAQAMRETLAAVLRSPASARLHYQPAGGAAQDRAAGAAWLTAQRLESSEEQVLVTAGGQNALHAIVGAALSPGDAVACGSHVYPGLKALARRFGIVLVPLSEMTAAALDQACRARPIAALYVVPTNDNPTAATLSQAEREAIAALGVERQMWVIEDDAYAPLAAERLPPIASLAPERTWHIASLSKIVSPALRVAFCRAPSVADALRLASDVHETAVMAPPLNAAMVAAWLGTGRIDALIDSMRDEVEARQRLAATILHDVSHRGHAQGYHLWIPLGERVSPGELVEALRPTGLSVVPSANFAVAADAAPAVRVSLGGALDRPALQRALRVLHGHLTTPHPRGAAMI